VEAEAVGKEMMEVEESAEDVVIKEAEDVVEEEEGDRSFSLLGLIGPSPSDWLPPNSQSTLKIYSVIVQNRR
jgi:hypothetical protein